VRHGDGFLHHNFVVAVLNDLFGIQARGGCSCAGPYGHRLLGIDLDRSSRFRRAIEGGCEGVKPGWVRVNFNYFISETVFDFIIEAVHLIAHDGWKLLPHYSFDPETALWQHRGHRHAAALSLRDLGYRAGKLEYRVRHLSEPESAFAEYLAAARRVTADAASAADRHESAPASLPADLEHLRWFPLPGEMAREL